MQQQQHDQATAQQVIRAAVHAAGGPVKVAEALGMSSPSVTGWMQRGSVPANRIADLCALGANVVPAEKILDAMARQAKSGKGPAQ